MWKGGFGRERIGSNPGDEAGNTYPFEDVDCPAG
jgi:hypothetical protein